LRKLPRLKAEQLGQIVDLRLADLRKLLEERKISLEVTEAARYQLLLTGYAASMGRVRSSAPFRG